ncbi:MAG: thiamine-phosphate kinase [Alphaproteobacteria bacterium]|nr:thiamine-phosphate kinase [Alphaproteobacteria bacterium]
MDEFGLIARFFAPLAAAEPGALGLTDDAAVLDLPPGTRLVAATDALVAGIHFLADDPPGDIARKLMRVNLSDLAAMGATPRAVLLAAVLPRGTSEAWLAAFADGLSDDAQEFGAPLVGGDTVATDGPLTLALTALGLADGGVLTRAGARAGDDVYVSGTIGDAALGLRVLRGGLAGLDEDQRAVLVSRYRVPIPRLALGRALVGIAHACIDVSDGLIADLGHICACSGLAAQVMAAEVPLSPAARSAITADRNLLSAVLGGGDDYELAFTAPPSARAALQRAGQATGVALARIGVMMPGEGVTVGDAAAFGLVLEKRGFSHF